MKNKKEEIKLLPCYEHWYRQWVEFYKNHKWVQGENGRWEFIEFPITPIPQLTPEEEKEFQEENRKAELLEQLENGEEIKQEELNQEDKFMIWKIKYGRKEV
jgi:hypothetical protein